jgi:hypothetical protein
MIPEKCSEDVQTGLILAEIVHGWQTALRENGKGACSKNYSSLLDRALRFGVRAVVSEKRQYDVQPSPGSTRQGQQLRFLREMCF